MVAFDPIRAINQDFLRFLQYFSIPPKLYKKSEPVVKLEREGRVRQEKTNIRNKELDKLEARRGGTLTGKLLQLSNFYSIDICYNIVMILKLSINKEL